MTVIAQIAERHFGRKTIKALALRGVRVVGMQSIPGSQGFLDSTTGYVVDDNGTGRVLSYLGVAGLAK